MRQDVADLRQLRVKPNPITNGDPTSGLTQRSAEGGRDRAPRCFDQEPDAKVGRYPAGLNRWIPQRGESGGEVIVPAELFEDGCVV